MTEQQPLTGAESADVAAATGTAASATDPAPFGRLTDELAELGFDAEVNTLTGLRTFTATDSPVAVALDDGAEPPRAVLTTSGTGGWEITFTAVLPDLTQVLYAGLHPDNPATATAALTSST